MPNTSRGNPWISIDDPADIEAGTRALAEALNLAALYDERTNIEDLPARGARIGHHIRVTATNVVYVWNGTAWIALTRGLNADGAAAEATIRTLGNGARQAAAGDDSRLSDQRTPRDNSVTLSKIAPALLPTGGAANGDEALRAIGTGRGQVAAGADLAALTAAHSGFVRGRVAVDLLSGLGGAGRVAVPGFRFTGTFVGGRPVQVQALVNFQCTVISNVGWYLFRDGVEIQTQYSNVVNTGYTYQIALSEMETPTAGRHTYEVRCGENSGGIYLYSGRLFIAEMAS